MMDERQSHTRMISGFAFLLRRVDRHLRGMDFLNEKYAPIPLLQQVKEYNQYQFEFLNDPQLLSKIDMSYVIVLVPRMYCAPSARGSALAYSFDSSRRSRVGFARGADGPDAY